MKLREFIILCKLSQVILDFEMGTTLYLLNVLVYHSPLPIGLNRISWKRAIALKLNKLKNKKISPH